MPDTVRLQAPAKINLHLRVYRAGTDGFHPLRSWFRTIDLHDVLGFTRLSAPPAPAPPAWIERMDLHCDDPAVPVDDRNLIVRVWGLMSSAVADEPEWVRVDLQKHIPVGGGLGGGSSDAAAAIAAYSWARRAASLSEPTTAAQIEVATISGSDVPFFLRHQLDGVTDATCTGRGAIVEPFTPGRRHVVLLMLPGLQVSTPAVYRQFDDMPPPPEDGDPDLAAWSHLPALELLPLLRNDLEPPAFALHPQLSRLRDDLEQRLGRVVRMTGSGSTLFTLFDDAVDAGAAASRLQDPRVRTVIA